MKASLPLWPAALLAQQSGAPVAHAVSLCAFPEALITPCAPTRSLSKTKMFLH